MDDEQKLFDLQDQYSSALVAGDREKAKELEDKLDEYITNGVISDNPPATGVENTDPADHTAEVQPASTEVDDQSEPSESDVAKDGEPAPSNETEDWLSSLDPRIRDNIQKLIRDKEMLEHQYKSREGREAAFQRRYEEQRKLAVQQEELIKKLQSLTALPQGQAPAAPKQNSPALSIEDDPDLKEIASTDEQLARTMLRREQLLRQEIEQLRNLFDEKLSPLQQQFEQVEFNTEWNKLVSVVPNAERVFRSKQWSDWVSMKSPRVRALAESEKAEEALEALRLYSIDMEQWYGNQIQQENPPVTRQVDARAGKVQQERERKLQAQPVGSAPARPAQKVEPTLEEIMADPELLERFQEKLYKEELKKKGII